MLNVIVNSKLLLSLKGTLLLLLAFTISYCWSNSQDFDKKEFKPHFVSKMCFLCTHNCLYLIQVPLWARNDMPPFSKTNPAHGDKNSNMSGLYNWFRLSLEFIQTGFKPFLSNNIPKHHHIAGCYLLCDELSQIWNYEIFWIYLKYFLICITNLFMVEDCVMP